MKLRQSRLFLLFFAPFLVLACSDSATEPGPAKSARGGAGGDGARPDVLLVSLEGVRADALSCYDPEGGVTPNMDALASEGTRFELAITSAAIGPPAHASILTGRFNHQHGLRVIAAEAANRLPDDVPTLATLLGAQGWATHAVTSGFTASKAYGFERGFETFDDVESKLNIAGQWGKEDQRRADETTDLALARLESLPADQPAFLWVHYWDAFDRVLAPAREFVRDRTWTTGQFDAEGYYRLEVSYIDQELGRLLDGLKATGRYDNTIVVVVSNFGLGLGNHDWEGHRVLYQEEIGVPLLIRGPGLPAGRKVAELVRTVDIVPTVLHYAGLSAPEGIAGLSAHAMMEGQRDRTRIAFADAINVWDRNGRGMLRKRPQDEFVYCVMNEDWKLLYRPTLPYESELYHLDEDPREKFDNFLRTSVQSVQFMELLGDEQPWLVDPPGDEFRAYDWAWKCPDDRREEYAPHSKCLKCGAATVLMLHEEGAAVMYTPEEGQ